jgi:hypothetical protein
MDDAIERTRRIADRLREQAVARYAFPWRFEAYPLIELAESPTAAELQAWMHELGFRFQQAIDGHDESTWIERECPDPDREANDI